MTLKKKQHVVVVVHDAGEAEIIGAYILANAQKYSFHCYAINPATNVLKRRKISFSPTVNTIAAVSEVLDSHPDCSFVLLGTGDGSNLGWKFAKECRKRGIPTVGYLEHWVVYRERFGYPTLGWKEHVPDTIWVGDKFAERIAKKFFTFRKVTLVPNLYWREVKKEYQLAKVKKKKGDELLFIAEPISYGCPRLLDELLTAIDTSDLDIRVRVRLHPREDIHSYQSILHTYAKRDNVVFTNNKNIISDLVRAKYIVGIGSMALVIAMLCKKKVFALTPDRSISYVLPFKEIIRVKSVRKVMSELTKA